MVRFSIIELLVSDDVSGSRDTKRNKVSKQQDRTSAIPCFRSDGPPSSDHLSNGEDTVCLESVESDTLPVAGFKEGSPP